MGVSTSIVGKAIIYCLGSQQLSVIKDVIATSLYQRTHLKLTLNYSKLRSKCSCIVNRGW
jgi:hypothetical protein